MEQDAGPAQAGAGALFDAHGRELYRYARALTGSHEEAEDLVQAGFVKLLEHLGQPGVNVVQPRAFLFQTVHNLAVNTLRRRSTWHKVSDALPAFVEARRADAAMGGAGGLDAEDLARLNRALGDLALEQREVVVLRHLEELPLADVARLLNVPPETVASRCRLAFEKLRPALARARHGG